MYRTSHITETSLRIRAGFLLLFGNAIGIIVARHNLYKLCGGPHKRQRNVGKRARAVLGDDKVCHAYVRSLFPSRLFFMIAAPNGANDEHLTILSSLATMIMDPDFKEALIAAKTVEEFRSLIDAKENGTFTAPNAAEESTESAPAADHIQILAVTACPTGIAHTFMAAESLEQHAKKRGISIKVETNGSAGAKNVLTPEEIAAADGIIVAADKNVAMSRFDGHRVVITKVADGINKADELIDRALAGSAPIYHASGADTAEGRMHPRRRASDVRSTSTS